MTGDISTRGANRALSPKAIELGRGFLSSLFMGLRTAQIHDSSNKAFERAVQNVRTAAEGLYSATGGFSVSFVDESAFLNGVRLRFDGTTFDAMVTLRHILEQRDLGGIEMRSPPSYDAVRKLILMFSGTPTEAINKEDLLSMQIGVLGVQRFADKSEGKLNIDRRVFAVHCYAKLMLAYREQLAAIEGEAPRNAFPRLRAVRIVQDVVELSGDRLDFLLRLGANHRGAPRDELHAANVCVLSVALGRALGLQRADLVDLGVGALLHDIGRSRAEELPELLTPVYADAAPEPVEVEPVPFDALLPEGSDGSELWFADKTQETEMSLAPGHPGHVEEMLEGEHPHARVSYARLLGSAGLGRGGLVRTLIAAEHHDARPERFLYSRIVGVVDAYDALCSGLGTIDGGPVDPLDVLVMLGEDQSGRIDADMLDLLINVLRAYPRGVEVVLDSGEIGLVHTHEGGSRWDRPIVHVQHPKARIADLMIRDGDRFVTRIRGTVRYLGMMVEASLIPEE